jgi:2-keto-3-deoxy-L-rhamnonate aldolase RhmA
VNPGWQQQNENKMRKNETRGRLSEGKVVVGVALQQLRSPELPRLLGAAGFDYIFIDAEHGGFNMETMQDMVKAAIQAGITPFIRVAELRYSLVARALDIGAQGIIMPRVEDPELLRTAIGWTRFPPHGTRGFGITAPQISYRAAKMVEIMDHANRETMNIVQFESVEALERSDELLAVKGVDVAMIGPADLSISMGRPGEFDHPELVGAIERFIADCQRHMVIPGIHCRSTDMAKPWIAKGMKLIGCGSEITMLMERAQSIILELGEPGKRGA